MKLIAGPGALCALAALSIALALQISNGAYDPAALGLVVLATLLAVAAALWLRFAPPQEDPLVARSLLALGAAAGLLCNFFVNPTAYGDPLAFRGGFQWFSALALVALSAYLCIHLRASLIKARFLLLLGCFLVLGIVVLQASPRPWIDVFTTQMGAAQALRDGHNPYSVAFPSPYRELTGLFYAPEMVERGQILAFGYPPLTALLDLPAFLLFRDVRVVSLLAMIAAAFALARALPGPAGELAAAFVLFQPRTLFVLEQAWTDSVLLAAAAFLLWFARRHWLAAGLALGFLVASKQYAVVVAVPLWFLIPREHRLRATLVGAALAAATVIPFAIVDLPGLWLGVVRLHVAQPLRPDSLSLLALWARTHEGTPGWAAILGFAGAALVLAVTLRRGLGSAQALAAAAAAWLVFVLFNKQAFCNYEWLGAALAAAAADHCAVTAGQYDGRAAQSSCAMATQ